MADFSEVFEDVTKLGHKIPKENYLAEGKYPIIDQGQTYIAGYSNNNEGLYSDVPAIIFGDHTRIIKYVDMPCFLGADGVKLLHVKDKDNDVKYLYYALCNARIPDTGYNRHFKWLKEVTIALPPLPEQRSIVSILDKVSELIALRKRQLDLLDEMVKARFVEMFGDPVRNEKSYPVKHLSDVAEYWNGLTYKPEDVSEKGIIVLRSSNIQNFKLDYSDIVRVSCKISQKKYVQAHDILMCSRNGSAKLVGKVALIDNINEPMSFGAFMMIIRSNLYSYLHTYFQLPAFRLQITTGATTTINQITTNMLNKIVLPVPDEESINQFADFVQQVDKSKATVQQGLDRLNLLKSALTQEYFG